MWICARCGTEARQPEICSGCGSRMRPFPEQAGNPRPLVSFVLLITNHKDQTTEAVGPFNSVLECDQWWAQHASEERFTNCVALEPMLMEAP